MGKNTCISATLWDNNNNVLEQNQMINDHNSSEIGGVKKNYVPFKLLGFGVCFQWMIVSSFGEDRCKKLKKKSIYYLVLFQSRIHVKANMTYIKS